ncbi:hypothetical protein COSHB9_01210 [Companilactobacillus alimentarius]
MKYNMQNTNPKYEEKQLCFADYKLANYKFNPNKPGIFQWQSVDDVFLMVVD